MSPGDLGVVLSSGRRQHHIKALRKMVREDFCGQHKFFQKYIVLQSRVAKSILTGKHRQRGMMFQAFKIKSKKLNSRNNCFSDKSLLSICQSSQHSLQELTIRNGHCLSEQGLSQSISLLNSLLRLDLSFCRQVTDNCLVEIFTS